MKINESLGIVDKPGVEWLTLSKVIRLFIIDWTECKNDVFINTKDKNRVLNIPLKGILKYYNDNTEHVNSVIGIKTKEPLKKLVPDWIYDFNIRIMPNLSSEGLFASNSVKLHDNKISFDVYVRKKTNISSYKLISYFAIIHEFLHAYSHWLSICKNANIKNSNLNTAYQYAMNNEVLRNNDSLYIKILGKILTYNNDKIKSLFTDAKYLEYILSDCFYYSELDEIRSYKLQFAELIKQILPEYSEYDIKNNIKEICEKDGYYKTYVLFYKIIKKLKETNLDDDIIRDAIKDILPTISYILNKKVSQNLLKNYNDNVLEIFKKLLKIFEKTFSDVLSDMQNIFYKVYSDYIELMKSKDVNESKSINESLGIVTNENKWDALCKIISTYIYDIEDGLNADPFYVDDPNVDIPITLKNVNSYSKYKYHKSIDKIIPVWVGKVSIEYTEGDDKVQGAFVKNTAEMNNNKLDFTIRLVDANIPNEKDTYSVLIHEFRHAYTRFLELSKGISIISKKDQHIYSTVLNRMRNKQYGKINLISTYYKDSVVIDESIYEDCDRLYSAFLSSLYYANDNEIKSFLEQFNADIEEQFKEHKKEIEDAIKKTSSIKNYDSLSDIEQYDSRILNIMPITPYDSTYFRRYKAYLTLWKNIDKIPDDITVDLFNRLKSVISIYLYNNILNVDILDNFSNADNGFTGYNVVIKKKVKNKILPQLEKVVRKMNQVYANKILKIREGLNT